MKLLVIFSATVSLLAASPSIAQEASGGSVAKSTVGAVGQRQTKEKGVLGIKPMARVDSRIQNRVQSRIRNRVDRSYDPQANAISPFAIAGDQARTAGRPRAQ